MKYILMTAAAVGALIATPALANGEEHGDHHRDPVQVHVNLSFANNIDTSVTTDVTYTKDVALNGAVELGGTINADSSAVAVNDIKQLQQGVAVTYREENELNGENGYVDPVFGPGWSEHGNNNDPENDGYIEGQIRAGFFAPIINTVDTFDITGDGNVGLNMAAGYFNSQLNSAVLATSDNANPEAAGGWAEASATSLQSLLGVAQYGAPSELLPEDETEQGGGGNNFRDRNTILGGTIGGAGNIGVNAAAGSLNQQANLLTIAVANDSTLAEANAGLVQAATLSYVEQQDSKNLVTGPTISASGNVGVNFAAGVGNQQLNSLTIAASQGSAQGGPTAPAGGNDPS